MTTTQAITTTIVKTVHVEPVPASIPPGNGFAGNGEVPGWVLERASNRTVVASWSGPWPVSSPGFPRGAGGRPFARPLVLGRCVRSGSWPGPRRWVIAWGSTVVLESTTYPGTTRGELLPILERESGLTAGADFHLAFSPERVDPGRTDWTTKTVPKVVGGIDDASADALEVILREEVAHVAAGSRWFRWFCERRGVVPEPTFRALLAEYARAVLHGPFNLEARGAAGFSEEELAALQQAAQDAAATP